VFNGKSNPKLVRFILSANLPARWRRFQCIDAARRKTRRSVKEKLMLIAIAAAVIVIAADQASKAFVLSRAWAVASNTGFLSVRRQLTRRGPLMCALAKQTLVGLWIASAAIAAVVLQTGMIAQTALNAACIGAALGGAAGNVADRLRHEAIVDFIAIGRWPPFNLADAAIVMGVGLLFFSLVET
jgi:signal peptidase II